MQQPLQVLSVKKVCIKLRKNIIDPCLEWSFSYVETELLWTD